MTIRFPERRLSATTDSIPNRSRNEKPNRIVQLTPPGRGAVATLLVEGPGTVRAAEELLYFKSGKTLSEQPVDRPILAYFGGENGEEVVVRRRTGDIRLGCHGHPAAAEFEDNAHWQDASGTHGQDASTVLRDDQHWQDASGTQGQIESLELHCHGGLAAISAIERAFAERDFCAISWKDWTAENAEHPIAAAALVALADARTERTAAILLDQYRGALGGALDDPKITYAQIEAILERAPLGLHLTKPWRVVLIGAPNVGKSSLLNALLGYCRAIVHHTPGTTRDVVAAPTAFEGWPVELCDTAGLRAAYRTEIETEIDDIERAGIELAQEQIARADLLLAIFDAGKSWTPAEQSFLERYPQALVVQNKADLLRSAADRPKGIFVSALTGQGIEELCRRIAQRLVPHPPPPGAAVPFTSEQIEMLHGLARRLEK
ncbi:MAG: 50S ribosome-binding GTPase [Pirellulales bacterium]|nr:50S ribosome-binding GTPase [Pirellulales bacterium]